MQDNYNYDDEWEGRPLPHNGDDWYSERPHANWFDTLRQLWQWDEVAAEIGQESQARVAIVGLPHAGQHLLFNRLRGWDHTATATDEVDTPAPPDLFEDDGWVEPFPVESFGLFILADLPQQRPARIETGETLLLQLAQPALVLYLLDATQGVRPADYRWIATLRASGRPLVVALNKADVLRRVETAVAEAERRLGTPVIPLSAYTGLNVEERLLPALLDAAPRLAVPLGRELLCLRRAAARRVMRQAAVLAGMMGAQPVPILDLPVQAMLQVGVVMRIGAAYGHAPTGGLSRELIGTIASSLGLRYLGLSLTKLVPLLGWAASGVFSGAATMIIGEAAIRYYEAGGTVPLAEVLEQVQQEWQRRRPVQRRRPWQRWRPALPSTTEVQVIPIQDVPEMEADEQETKET